LAALHGPDAGPLHDDFYDDEGIADQNSIPVTHASLFPLPRLSAVSGDLNALLDYAVARWDLDVAAVEALRAHPASDVVSRMSEIIGARPVLSIENRCYEIAARALGSEARSWIESRWGAGSRLETLHAFLQAVAACIPTEDAIFRAIAAVDRAGARDLSTIALALTRFRSPVVLDWMEERVRSPVSDRWGWLAGCSGMTWTRAMQWLQSGRPLSLVALDAIADAFCPSRASTPPGLVADIKDAPPLAAILEHLEAYARGDPAPRITKIISRVAEAVNLPT
jgi:hypothetical protein